MAPSQKEQIEKLATENAALKSQVASLTERLEKLEASLDSLSLNHSETVTRLEGVEDNLCQVTSEQLELQQDQADLAIRLEAQQMYSRRQTLLLTGQAVGPQTRGENLRRYVVNLLKEYLGITDLDPRDICACHRLRNPMVILVRFVSLDDSERVYRARTKPKKKGLLIFESLTSERLATINVLRDLKKESDNPIVSYYTQSGRIFAKISDSKEVKPVEIPFGASRQQIKDLCGGKKVTISPMDVRDHVRQVNGSTGQHNAGSSVGGSATRGPNGNWQKVQSKKKVGGTGNAAVAETQSCELPRQEASSS